MISIAMATYNGGRYIREQLDSILSQTVRDFELVVSDDCSADDTWDILEEYAGRDGRIRLYRNGENVGFKRNFERAISLCEGDYVALSDQDDIWLPNHLELLLDRMDGKMIACGNAELVDSRGHPMNLTLDAQESLDYVPDDDLKKAYSVIFYRNPYQGASMLLKREFLDKALPIPDESPSHDVWFSCLGCFYGGISHFSDVITLYRRHGYNLTGKKEKRNLKLRSFIGHMLRSQSWSNRIYIIDNIMERLPDLPPEQRAFLENARKMFGRKNTIWGRLRNSLYELRHYKYIFSCGGTHWV